MCSHVPCGFRYSENPGGQCVANLQCVAKPMSRCRGLSSSHRDVSSYNTTYTLKQANSSVRRPGERKLTIAKMINSDDVSME